MKLKKLVIKEVDPESEVIEIDRDRLVDCKTMQLEVRAQGEFKGKAYYLDTLYDWEIGYDSDGAQILVRLKKWR